MHPDKNIIDRYLSEGLPPGADTKLRSHLRVCESCRSYYDQQVVLLRALSGDPDTPTEKEENRMVRLTLLAAGLAEPRKEEKLNLLDRLVWARIPLMAAAVLALVLMAVSALHLLSVTTQGPEIAAGFTKARDLTINGVPVDVETSTNFFVLSGARLEVGPRGIAELSLRRGGIVRVFPGTALSLHGPGSRLDLESGKVWCLIGPATEPFMVSTDTAEVRVVGTSFVVGRRQSGETEVRVLDGEVEVKNKKRQEKVLVSAGHKTQVDSDRPPRSPRRYGPASVQSEWERDVDELWRDIKRVYWRIKRHFEDN